MASDHLKCKEYIVYASDKQVNMSKKAVGLALTDIQEGLSKSEKYIN